MKIKDNNLNWTLNVIARVFVGIVFLFSSFVKGVDPLGTSYKITEYLTAWSFFGMSFEWLVPMATVMAMGLIVAEFTVGVMLIFGCFRKFSAWLLALMMLFFTCTTLIDAITNQVTDCGCFGDAVKLTNWQTFWKNIVLDVPTVWILLTCNLRNKKRFERDFLITVFAAILMVIFGLYNINNEPCIDFRSWKVGNQMVDTDESLQVQSYVTYRNKQTGETKEFKSEELVAMMADTDYRIVGKGELYLQNFLFVFFRLLGLYVEVERATSDGRTDMVVQTSDYVYILEFKLDKTADEALRQIEEKGYAKPFAADRRPVYKIGVNFNSQQRCVDDWKIVE
jgi:uncharacterized membrane protein YphA (DoxX/SURF4 family)